MFVSRRSTVALIALFVVTDIVGHTKSDEQYATDFTTAVQKAMEQIQLHGNWLKTNVTKLLNEFKADPNQDSLLDDADGGQWSLDSMEKLLATLREQVKSFSKQVETGDGKPTTLQTLWEAFTNRLAYMTNLLTGKTSVRQAMADAKDKLSTARKYFEQACRKFTNFLLPIYAKLTGRREDLQNNNLNITLDRVLEMGKKFYQGTADDKSVNTLLERVNSLWQQVFNEITSMKGILTDKDAIAKKLSAAKQMLIEKGPESVKALLNEYDKNKDEKNLLNLISMALGKKISELMNNPSLVNDFMKNFQ